MLLDGIILGIIIGLFRRGSFTNLLQVDIPYVWLIIPAYLLQRVSIYFLPSILPFVVPITYLIIMFVFFKNRRQFGFFWSLLGMFANFLVTSVNGGRMPVEVSLAEKVNPEHVEPLLSGSYFKHIPMSDQTHLNLLGDIFFIQPPYPHTTLVSLGDILISIGIMLFIQYSMVNGGEKKVGTIHAAANQG
jgi:hypothetical protein